MHDDADGVGTTHTAGGNKIKSARFHLVCVYRL